MEIARQSDGRSFLTAGSVTLPIFPGTLNDLLAHAKLLSRAQLEEVVKDAGLESHPLVEDRSVFLVAVSFAQNLWYEDVVKRLQAGETLPSNIPPNLATLEGRNGEEKDGALTSQAYALTRHAERLAAFKLQVERAREAAAKMRRPLGPQGSAEHQQELRAKLPQLPTPKVAPVLIDGQPDLVSVTLDGSVVVHLTQDGSVWFDAVDTPKEAVAEAILVAAGYEVPAGTSLDVMEPVVKGVVRRWWYEDNHGPVPEDLTYEQQLLYKRYLSQVKHPPKKVKEPKPAREQSAKQSNDTESNVKGSTTPEPPSRPRAIKDVKFAVVTPYDGRGQTKFIYDAVVKITSVGDGAAPLELVVAQAEQMGFATKEPGGSTPRVRWLALELVKKGFLKVIE